MTDFGEHHGPPSTDPVPRAVIEHRSTRQRHGREPARISVNLTTMIDVTFLLLVYFMVATEFKLGENVYRLDLPRHVQSDRERDPFDLDDQPIRIGVATTGPARQSYRLSVDWPDRQPLGAQELFSMLQSKQLGESGGLYAADHPIVIQPARSARWEHAIEVFNAVARARYTNVQFAKPG